MDPTLALLVDGEFVDLPQARGVCSGGGGGGGGGGGDDGIGIEGMGGMEAEATPGGTVSVDADGDVSVSGAGSVAAPGMDPGLATMGVEGMGGMSSAATPGSMANPGAVSQGMDPGIAAGMAQSGMDPTNRAHAFIAETMSPFGLTPNPANSNPMGVMAALAPAPVSALMGVGANLAAGNNLTALAHGLGAPGLATLAGLDNALTAPQGGLSNTDGGALGNLAGPAVTDGPDGGLGEGMDGSGQDYFARRNTRAPQQPRRNLQDNESNRRRLLAEALGPGYTRSGEGIIYL